MYTYGFFGAGNMAEGILATIEDKSAVIMAEKNGPRAKVMAKRYGVAVTDDVKAVAKNAKTIFLAVRPQEVDAVAAAVKPLLRKTQLVVSIVAGKTLAKLRKAFGSDVRLIRVMPNLGLRVQAGACGLSPDKSATKADVKRVSGLLERAGAVSVLPEKALNAVTGLSGSGPAWCAYMLKAMVESGRKLGVPETAALRLSAMTMLGTVGYLTNSGVGLDDFIAAVCTKGGTTAAGMDVLAKSDFAAVVDETIKAAAKRASELC